MRGILSLALVLCSTTAEAGAWTRSLGSFYTKVGVDAYAASKYQAADFVSTDGQSFLGYQIGVYGEVGLLKVHPLMVAVQAPWASSTLFLEEKTGSFRPRATTRRLGDLRFTAQTSLLPDGGPLSASVEVKVPMYANDSVGSRYGGFEELFPLAGEGQVDLTGWILGGASFGGPLWGEAAVGYQHRTQGFIGWRNHGDLNFLDRIRFGAGLGFSEGPVVAILRVDGQKAIGADAITAESVSAGPVLLVDVAEGLAIEGRFSADLWANNATQGFGFGTGVSIRR
ncbi:MAG: hypothetical protein KC912_15240 [Proteobacteria bacterium]|nr:hypothetical protein [Pseudomonadota bacterium]